MGITDSAASFLLLVICIFCCASFCNATNFAQCQATVQDALSSGALTTNSSDYPIYHGVVPGINASSQPLLLTLEGCKKWCGGNTPQFSSSVDAFGILTTWVLPVITLLSSLPYESTSRHGFGNFEAFVNWTGAPAATLSTTLWNIRMMHKCRMWAKKPECAQEKHVVRDTMYILSCINQYEYPRRDSDKMPYLRRDRALLRGALFPYLNRDTISDAERKHLVNITRHLAFQLRLLRRRGVYPLAFGMFWFFLSLVFSIVISFDTALGDNSEAHSLALGLLLVWLPVLVYTAYLDRNPVSSKRCAIMMERWLCEVEALFEKRFERRCAKDEYDLSTDMKPLPSQPKPDLVAKHRDRATESKMEDIELRRVGKSAIISAEHFERTSNQRLDKSTTLDDDDSAELRIRVTRDPSQNSFKIGRFIGQGRKIRYCAVTDTILNMAIDQRNLSRLPSMKDAERFQEKLPHRPVSWYAVWCLSFLTVAVGFTTAFFVTYQTPPIGIGCRCLSYLIWYAPSTVSWALLGLYQEPGPLVHAFMFITNIFATVVLIAIMLLQVINGLNNCWCKAVTFVPDLVPGYMDFDDGKWWLQAASHVRATWGIATASGLLGSVGVLLWLTWGHEKDKSLWHVNEGEEIECFQDVNLDWLR